MASEIKGKIDKDLIEALKSKDALKAGTLRMALSAIHNREIEKRGKGDKPELTDDEVLAVLEKEAKKRKEAIELFTKGGRAELAEKEAAELKIVAAYLPKKLPEGEVNGVVLAVVAELKPQSQKDFGRVMGEIMKRLKGKADAGMVSNLLKKALGGE